MTPRQFHQELLARIRRHVSESYPSLHNDLVDAGYRVDHEGEGFTRYHHPADMVEDTVRWNRQTTVRREVANRASLVEIARKHGLSAIYGKDSWFHRQTSVSMEARQSPKGGHYLTVRQCTPLRPPPEAH